MSVKMIQEKLNSYRAASWQEEEFALREILQEVALAGLSRSGFFKEAVFQGGAALRVLYGTDRFSEDLDFALNKVNPTFRLDNHFSALRKELEAYGIFVAIQNKTKEETAIHKALFKKESIERQLNLQYYPVAQRPKRIRIRFEVDTNPPAGATFETKYLDYPFAFGVAVQDLPSLFAGKSHALLCREYVKGRDWYDFIWYVAGKTNLNYKLLANACRQQGEWKGQNIVATKAWYLSAMKKKIETINWEEAKQDVARFLRPAVLPSLDLWDSAFFLDRLEKLKNYLNES